MSQMMVVEMSLFVRVKGVSGLNGELELHEVLLEED